MSACCSPQRNDAPGASHRAGGAVELLVELASQAPADLQLVGLHGGTFLMGSDGPEAYAADGEGPVRHVAVEPFAIAPTTVTNAQFAAFVLDTGYRTDAQLHGDSLVFAGLLDHPARNAMPAVRDAPWWRQVAGANWLYPTGTTTSVGHRGDHPVTHVSRRDAEAYAAWAGVRLLTEAEWEFAARGGLVQQPFPWGSEREPNGVARMNTFVGEFPEAPDASVGTMAVTSFEPNAYGLYNMTGNVWEWTSDVFGPDALTGVLRGGSYMCHISYCRRYRTSARSAATPDTSLGHTGFRIGLTPS